MASPDHVNSTNFHVIDDTLFLPKGEFVHVCLALCTVHGVVAETLGFHYLRDHSQYVFQFHIDLAGIDTITETFSFLISRLSFNDFNRSQLLR